MHTFDVVLAFLVGIFVVLKFVGEYAKKKEEEAVKDKKLAKAESVEKLAEQMKAERIQPVKVQESGKGAQLDVVIYGGFYAYRQQQSGNLAAF